MAKAVIILEVPEESIGAMCSVAYIDENRKVQQEPSRLLDYEDFLKTEKSQG